MDRSFTCYRYIRTMLLSLVSLVIFNSVSGQGGTSCFTDQTTTDFNQGSYGANTQAHGAGDGAVSLKPGIDEEFSGNSLPSGWGVENFDPSGSTDFQGGDVTVNGTHIYSNASFGPGSVLEFVATFNSGAFQNIGFSSDAAFNAPWVTIGQGSIDGLVHARYSGGTQISLGPLLGSPHLYRIEWNVGSFNFIVDNGVSAFVTIPFDVNIPMYVQISDLLTGDGSLSVDWIRLTPYPASGVFTSRVFDAGSTRTWTGITWNGDLPAGTSIDVEARTGNTSTPDGSWSSYTSTPNQSGRYVQYRATLATTDPHATPVLFDVALSCENAGPMVTEHPADATVCTGSTVSFTSAATGVTSVKWQVNTNGNSWSNVSGANSATLSFTANTSHDGNRYRAVWNGPNGQVISDPARLTVNPLPSLTSAGSLTVNSGENFNYHPTSSVPGTSFTWTRAAVNGISNPAVSGSGSINESLENTSNSPKVVTYVYTLTANGCTKTQNVLVTVNAASSDCITTTSVSQHFNNYTISAGRYIWFNSIFNIRNIGSGETNIYVTNSKITYKLNNVTYTLNVPDAHIQMRSNIWNATTEYTSDGWKTKVNSNFGADIFLTGLSYRLPHDLPKKVKDVKWTMDVRIDKPDALFKWKWSAGVYSNFSLNHNSLHVSPTDGILSLLSPFINIGNAGTPTSYALYIIPGGTTTGLFNLSNTFSSTAPVNCNSIVPNVITSQPLMEEPGILDNSELSLKAYPNPSRSNFNLAITGNDGKPVNVRVYDANGRMVEGFPNVTPGTTLTTGERWKSGIYLVEVQGADQRKVIKIVKAN